MPGTGIDGRRLRQPNAPVLERGESPPSPLSTLDNTYPRVQSWLQPGRDRLRVFPRTRNRREQTPFAPENHPTDDNWPAIRARSQLSRPLSTRQLRRQYARDSASPCLVVMQASGYVLMSGDGRLLHDSQPTLHREQGEAPRTHFKPSGRLDLDLMRQLRHRRGPRSCLGIHPSPLVPDASGPRGTFGRSVAAAVVQPLLREAPFDHVQRFDEEVSDRVQTNPGRT